MLEANKLGALAVLLSDALEDSFGDLSPSAAALLSTLEHFNGSTASELAAVAGIAQPTATRVLDGLERQGLVRRGAKTGRQTPLHLTANGRRRSTRLKKARDDAMARLLDFVPEDRRNMFLTVVDGMLTGATTSRRFARTTCRHCDHGICTGPACPIGSRATEIEQDAKQHTGRSR